MTAYFNFSVEKLGYLEPCKFPANRLVQSIPVSYKFAFPYTVSFQLKKKKKYPKEQILVLCFSGFITHLVI